MYCGAARALSDTGAKSALKNSAMPNVILKDAAIGLTGCSMVMMFLLEQPHVR
jgi:hypothetical protein